MSVCLTPAARPVIASDWYYEFHCKRGSSSTSADWLDVRFLVSVDCHEAALPRATDAVIVLSDAIDP
jgi:hypothetical protein